MTLPGGAQSIEKKKKKSIIPKILTRSTFEWSFAQKGEEVKNPLLVQQWMTVTYEGTLITLINIERVFFSS